MIGKSVRQVLLLVVIARRQIKRHVQFGQQLSDNGVALGTAVIGNIAAYYNRLRGWDRAGSIHQSPLAGKKGYQRSHRPVSRLW